MNIYKLNIMSYNSSSYQSFRTSYYSINKEKVEDLEKEIKSLNERLTQMEKECKERIELMEETLKCIPGGPVYTEAKYHFEGESKN